MALYQIARLLLSGCDLLSFLDLFHSRTSKRAGKIIADPSHPGQHLFQRLPSGTRLRASNTTTTPPRRTHPHTHTQTHTHTHTHTHKSTHTHTQTHTHTHTDTHTHTT